MVGEVDLRDSTGGRSCLRYSPTPRRKPRGKRSVDAAHEEGKKKYGIRGTCGSVSHEATRACPIKRVMLVRGGSDPLLGDTVKLPGTP